MRETISANTIVVVNSASACYAEGSQLLLPYLDHLGVPFTVADLAQAPLPPDVGGYALVIIAHRRLDPLGTRLTAADRVALLQAAYAGAGLVSFDPALPSAAELGLPGAVRGSVAESVEFTPGPHYITSRHEPGEVRPLAHLLRVPALAARAGDVRVTAGGRPLVVANVLGQGRLVRWATAGWLHSAVLGPLGGLDDVLWQSLVWAARKPFALRGLPPLVTMRIDDVAAQGGLWGQSPLYWVHEANRHGFKPWLGLFIYNLTAPAVAELRDLVLRGQATAFPHAFGRAVDREGNLCAYYDPRLWRETSAADRESFARRHGRSPYVSDLDEFIYFDHWNRRPWPAAELAKRLAAVDSWYAAHAPLPISHVALPHWYEADAAAIRHMHDRWGCEFSAQPADVEQAFGRRVPWLPGGPFRRYERPGGAFAMSPDRGGRPVYYADAVNLAGRPFFNCLTEIRDDAGYEWRPDNDVEATIGRGVRQLRRALDSMALAVLFTHETDHIYCIRPEAWAAAVAGVARGVAAYAPIYLTMDDAVRYVRATRTSRLADVRCDPAGRQVTATFAGHADIATHFYLFSHNGEDSAAELVSVPPFADGITVTAPARGRQS